jgi:FkbM family methyltransferase
VFHVPGLDAPLLARIGTSDLAAFRQVFGLGGYALELPFEPRVILDLGANVGYTAVDFALRYPAARVVAVEPEPSNAAVLRRNVAALQRIDVIEGAVWPHGGRLETVDAGKGKWGHRVREEGRGRVRAYSVQELLARVGAGEADLVKIDIEGSELELFSENTEWVGRTKAIAIELHDRFRPGCREALDGALARSGTAFRESTFGESVVFVRADVSG